MPVEFTAHNIRLDDGSLTRPDEKHAMDAHAWFIAAKRILETVFPGDKRHLRLADVGCLEGGYSVEFARMGFQVVGIEVRDANIAACNYVKERTNLPNLTFAKDDAWNIAKYGPFDVVFCSGLLYHFDRPKEYLKVVSSVTTKLLILQTHFATDSVEANEKFHLSEPTENEGLAGRWYTEFPNDESFGNRESTRWASWDNRRSFWIQREHLLQAIGDVGFNLVMEQFDGLGPNIAESMLKGYYHTDSRGTFIGIKA
ncbi:MAG: methyltransferase domain-containing protein [Chthoniobacteraceae bacterium]